MSSFKSKVLSRFKKKEKVVKEEKEENEGGREEWSSGIDFFLSSLGYAGKLNINLNKNGNKHAANIFIS